MLLTTLFAGLMFAIVPLFPRLVLRLSMATVISILIAAIGAVVCGMGVVSFRYAKTTVNPTTPEQNRLWW